MWGLRPQTPAHGCPPRRLTEVEKFATSAASASRPRTSHGTLDDVIALYEEYAAGCGRRSTTRSTASSSTSTPSTAGAPRRGHHRPRGAVAFKFASPAKVTTVLDLPWDTGSSGRITPVAIVAPVELAGATVQRASLHNAANVRALGIGKGDEVLVSRRNDVIPYVEEVVRSAAPPPCRPPCARCAGRPSRSRASTWCAATTPAGRSSRAASRAGSRPSTPWSGATSSSSSSWRPSSCASRSTSTSSPGSRSPSSTGAGRRAPRSASRSWRRGGR